MASQSLTTVTRPAADEQREIRDFAASARDACRTWPGYDRWTPAAPCDDSDDVLRERLSTIGWFDLAVEDGALAFVAAAAVELGRAAMPLDLVDGLLGHPLAIGPGLAHGKTVGRYVASGRFVWRCDPGEVRLAQVTSSTPVGYVDSQGVALLETDDAGATSLDEDRRRAWVAAAGGYASGLAAAMHEMAVSHTRAREAFGGVVADLDVVAARLADSAMASEGLSMAVEDKVDPDFVRHAVVTATAVSRSSQQLHGALGFTLEFPLQRFTRRAWALESWTLAVIEPMTWDLSWTP